MMWRMMQNIVYDADYGKENSKDYSVDSEADYGVWWRFCSENDTDFGVKHDGDYGEEKDADYGV